MRIKEPHAQYIARKISIELHKCGFVSFKSGLEQVAQLAQEILLADIASERALEAKVEQILNENENDIEFMQVDRRNMFWLIKKRLARDSDFILEHDDRYSRISHEILNQIWQKDLIDYKVSENKVKNVIYSAIEGYLKGFNQAEDAAFDELEKREKKLVVGSDEYEIAYHKAYEEQLKKRGII